jgi:hypothetical protein
MQLQAMKRAMLGLLVVLLAACAPGRSDDVSGDGEARSLDEHFSDKVQPGLDFCRTCHVPGAPGDVEDGHDFMLSTDKSQDLANLKASWERLGGNNPTSRILLMASGQETPHTGGAPWAVGSAAYRNMEILLKCFENPSGCSLRGGVDPGELLPLLGSARGSHVWESYCEDQPDSAKLPVDPRTLIRPGVNADKAVFFNAWFEDCHVNLPAATQAPKTCGAYRAQRELGKAWFRDAGSAAEGNGMPAEQFSNAWKRWGGLSERPENYDEMYALRYGMNPAPYHNPYPLPGEDPNLTNGGSGQLPQGRIQRKDANGKWTGIIGNNACYMCHGGQLGEGSEDDPLRIQADNIGPGNSNTDLAMMLQDGVLALLPVPGVPLTLEQLGIGLNLGLLGMDQRGQNNAVGGFELIFMLTDYDSVGLNPNALKLAMNSAQPHPTVEQQDTPAWWNFGHRSRKFFDAGVSTDSTRIIMAAGNTAGILSGDGKAFRAYADQHARNAATYFLSLSSPAYPGDIDTTLAEQGAVLFHSKDLWASAANAEKPRPLGGNGSCASCHGAYSPRYVHDPAYLESPALEGMAGHISPLDVIGTDPARADELSPYLRDAYSTTWWAFPEGQPGWKAPEEKTAVEELADDGLLPSQRVEGACGWERGVIGYQAPPLYGVWATPPYFHNGSVPTIEQVLKSSERPAIWQRKLKEIGPVKGFDLSMKRAYDHQRVGWQYDELSCAEIPGLILLNCNPLAPQQPSITQLLTNVLYGTVNWASVVTVPDVTPGGIDKRLVYDTRKLGNGNGGHDFSDVLTDQERKAVIEYLKTL